MPGFFETIARGKEEGRLLAAWVTAGEAAGARALFRKDADGYAMLYRDDGFPEEAAAEITAGKAEPENGGIPERNGTRVFLETCSGRNRLVICGAGHVSLSLIRIAAMLGYAVTAIDDRAEFAGKAREAGAEQVICRGFGEALDAIGDDPAAYVIMTREHSHDVECLRKILRKPFVYAGMMGSRSRTEKVRQRLLEDGIDAGTVAQVHMPIGLAIGSRTPEEIAVSVAAELISVLNRVNTGEGFPPGMAEELAQAERTGAPSVLAMLVEKKGEAPRRPGTKMLVRGDGSFLGTVGGGYAEALILENARKMIAEGETGSRLMKVSMKKGEMYCGGEITALLTPVRHVL